MAQNKNSCKGYFHFMFLTQIYGKFFKGPNIMVLGEFDSQTCIIFCLQLILQQNTFSERLESFDLS